MSSVTSNLTNPSQMSKSMVLVVGMFLGLLFAVLVLGFSKSPKASPATGRTLAKNMTNTTTSSPSRTLQNTSQEVYPSNKSDYK